MPHPRSPYKEQQRERHPCRDAFMVCVTHRYSKYALITTIVMFLALSSGRDYRAGTVIPSLQPTDDDLSTPKIRNVKQISPTDPKKTKLLQTGPSVLDGETDLPTVDSSTESPLRPSLTTEEGAEEGSKSSHVKRESPLSQETTPPLTTPEQTVVNFEKPGSDVSESPVVLTERSKEKSATPHKPTVATDSPEPNGALTGDYESYSPEHHPILDPKTFHPDKDKPVQVQIFLGAQSSHMRYFVGGVERSVYTKLVSVSLLEAWNDVRVVPINSIRHDKPTVWLVDFESLDQDCHKLYHIVEGELKTHEYKGGVYLVLLDMSGSSEVVHCPTLETLVPRDHIRFARRGIVQNRYWNEKENWVDMGNILRNGGAQSSGGPVLHVPFVVRESVVAAADIIISSAQKRRGDKMSPVKVDRPMDVAQFWNKGDYAHYSFLRMRVSSILASMDETKAGGRRVHTLVETKGIDLFHNETQPEYIEGLLSTKIVVVAQHDEWEDHYRLFDSLVSGALVMTDAMHGLPNGLKHKQNIVVYDSAESLEELLRYYLDPKNDERRLEIAQNGWKLAMGRHRAWHRVEQLLFGKPMSHVDKYYEEAPAKRSRTISR